MPINSMLNYFTLYLHLRKMLQKFPISQCITLLSQFQFTSRLSVDTILFQSLFSYIVDKTRKLENNMFSQHF